MRKAQFIIHHSMKKYFSLSLTGLALALLCACTQNADRPLMEGTVKFLTPEQSFAVNYLPDGNLYEAQIIDLVADSVTGRYTFDMELPDGKADVDVLVGQDIFAAHLVKGKTVRLDFVEQEDGTFTCTFGGDNADVSEAVAAMALASDLFSLQDMTPAEEQAAADKRHETAVAKIAAIKDEQLRDYYGQLCNAQYTGMKLRILGDRAAAEGCKETDYPEYAELIATIDPNSDIDYRAMNSILWLGSAVTVPEPAFKGDYSTYCIAQMDVVDSLITHPLLRKQMAYAIPNTFFAYGDHETGKEEFWTRYKEFAKDYPQYIEAFTAEYEKVIQDMDGQPVPDIMLERPDGSKVSIKSLQGKYTYIDVWATWCGPCCKEIPFVEKLVEQMKDNKNLQFVSFSVDADRGAWEAKLQKDQPAWPQFILDSEANKTLSDALAITGIPRFFILGPDGIIINQDAKRPSDPELVEYLNELTQ